MGDPAYQIDHIGDMLGGRITVKKDQFSAVKQAIQKIADSGLIKIEKAKELLAQGGGNVSQIAYKLGYENPESLIRQFKKFTHRTPAKFRQNIAKQKPGKRVKSST